MTNALYKFFEALWFVPLDNELVEHNVDVVENPLDLIEQSADRPLTPAYFRRMRDLRTPRRLATTPTEAHMPGRPSPSRSGKKTSIQRACPHCSNKVNVKLGTGSITKSTPRKGRRELRYVLVKYPGSPRLVEDRSPTTRLRTGKGVGGLKYY